MNGKYTDEWKQETSNFMKKYHKTHEHPMLGKTHSYEAKEKMSKVHKGKIISEEHKEIISQTHKTPEDIEKLIIEAYLNGNQIKSITIQFEISAKSIYRILDRNNIEKRSKKNV